MSHTTEVMAIFVRFLLILANIWLPWQRPLDPISYWDWLTTKTLLKVNRIKKWSYVISPRNAYIRTVVRKFVAVVMPFIPCVRECHKLFLR